MTSWRSCIALGSNTCVAFSLNWVLAAPVLAEAWIELGTATAAAAAADARHDTSSRPRPHPTDLALLAVHAIHPDAGAQRFPVQHACCGSGGEKLCAAGAVSADALSCGCAGCGCRGICCVVPFVASGCGRSGSGGWSWGLEQAVRPTNLSGTLRSDRQCGMMH